MYNYLLCIFFSCKIVSRQIIIVYMHYTSTVQALLNSLNIAQPPEHGPSPPSDIYPSRHFCAFQEIEMNLWVKLSSLFEIILIRSGSYLAWLVHIWLVSLDELHQLEQRYYHSYEMYTCGMLSKWRAVVFPSAPLIFLGSEEFVRWLTDSDPDLSLHWIVLARVPPPC